MEFGIKKIWNKFGEKSSNIFRLITSNNGSECSSLSKVLTDTAIYYAIHMHPLKEEAIYTIEHWNNHLPRRMFNYTSSNDAFSYYLTQL